MSDIFELKVDEVASVSVGVTEEIIYAISPTAKVERETDGVLITITDKDGTTTAEVFDGAKGDKGDTGAQGEKGADGYTPVKGVDYFTEADKEEMVDRVLAAKVLYVDDEGYICLKESENG